MYKNRIRDIRWWTNEQMIAKSISIKGTGCKSGGCARKAVELTSGDLLLQSVDFVLLLLQFFFLGASREGPNRSWRSAGQNPGVGF